MDGENNFLRFMPSRQRNVLHDEWYAGIIPDLTKISMPPLFSQNQETGVNYKTHAYKQEFLLKVTQRLKQAAGPDDNINRCRDKNCVDANVSAEKAKVLADLRQLANVKGRALGTLPETSFLRVKLGTQQDDIVFTLLVDKDLKNLSTLFVEDLRHDPEKDQLTIVSGFLGSYPNMFFEVDQETLSSFIVDLANSDNDERKEMFYNQYAIRRTNPDFWNYSDWMNEEHRKNSGVAYGLFDLNRYENL